MLVVERWRDQVFFNSKKYRIEAEKNRKQNLTREPSMFNMISLGLLASFAPTRQLLKLFPLKLDDQSQTQRPLPADQIPVIYFHGFRGGDYTTNVMVHQALVDQQKSDYLKVTIDLLGHCQLTGCWTNDHHPIVQVVFRHRIAGIYATDYYLSRLLPVLKRQYGFDHYDGVAHSIACPALIRTEMRAASKRQFPHLHRCAMIAGPFNGVTYLGDIPNVNALTDKGRPSAMNLHYLYLLLRRKRFNPEIAVLNIYGNVLDNTNTDSFISVVSAKSIRYILAPYSHSYHEVEIRGAAAEHSWMHDNPFVIDIIDQFLGLK